MRIPSSPRSFGLASKLALVVSRRDKHKLGYQDLNDDDEEINVDEIHVDDYSIDVVTLPPITTSTTKSVTTSCRQAAEVLETPTTSKKEDVSIVATSRTSNVPQTIDVESNSFKRNLADVKSSSSSCDMHESKASVLEALGVSLSSNLDQGNRLSSHTSSWPRQLEVGSLRDSCNENMNGEEVSSVRGMYTRHDSHDESLIGLKVPGIASRTISDNSAANKSRSSSIYEYSSASSSDAAGLQILPVSRQISDNSGANKSRNSSIYEYSSASSSDAAVFEYNVDNINPITGDYEVHDDGSNNSDLGSLKIEGSSSTVDLDAHLTYEEIVLGVPAARCDSSYDYASGVRTPIESTGSETKIGSTPSSYIGIVEISPTEERGAMLPTPHVVSEKITSISLLKTMTGETMNGVETEKAKSSSLVLTIPSLGARESSDETQVSSSTLLEKAARQKLVSFRRNDNSPSPPRNEDKFASRTPVMWKRQSLAAAGETEILTPRNEDTLTALSSNLAYGKKQVTIATDTSPTGVDELQEVFEEDEGREIEGQKSDDFCASDGWYRKDTCTMNDDSASSVSSTHAFGPVKVHALVNFWKDGAKNSTHTQRTIMKLPLNKDKTSSSERAIDLSYIPHSKIYERNFDEEEESTQHVIELRHSMESDCGQSESSSLQPMMEEEEKEVKDRSNSLGSFDQIYTPITASSAEFNGDELSDFDDNVGKGDVIIEQELLLEEIEQMHCLGRSRPWAKYTGNSEYGDLTSVPSEESMSSKVSLGNVQIPEKLSNFNDDGNTLTMTNVGNLKNFWDQDWTEMAKTTKSTTVIEGPCDSHYIDQPRFLLKEHFGDAMDEGDDKVQEELDTSTITQGSEPENNIIADRDGNQYLRIYDLSSGENTYEIIEQPSYELETVEERSCEESSVEDEEVIEEKKDDHIAASKMLDTLLEKTVESKKTKLSDPLLEVAQPQHSVMEKLYQLFDTYLPVTIKDERSDSRSACKIDPIVTIPLPVTLKVEGNDIRSDPVVTIPQTVFASKTIKSSKKSRIPLKRRAIVGAMSERRKYDLSYLEKKTRDLAFKSREKREKRVWIACPDTLSKAIVGPRDSFDSGLSTALSSLSLQENGCMKTESPSSDIEDYDESTMKEVPSTVTDVPSNVTDTPKEFKLVERKSLYAIISKPATSNDRSLKVTQNDMNDNRLDQTLGKISALLSSDDSSFQSSVESCTTYTSAATTTDEMVKRIMLRKGDFVVNSFAPSLITSRSSVSVDSELYSKHDDKRIRIQSPDQTNDRKSTGPSSMLTKLYDENAELAETLANTQLELARLQTKFKLLNYEIDHIATSAQYEM